MVPFCLVLPAPQYRLCAGLGLSPTSISYFIASADEAGLDLLEREKSQESKRKENIAVPTRHKHNPVLDTRESTPEPMLLLTERLDSLFLASTHSIPTPG